MPPVERDAALLWDMREACREACAFTQGFDDAEDFENDRKLCLAVERCLEIAGEAAGRTSGAFRVAHPGIPWQQLRGLRNILVHEYGQIDHAVIHKTVTRDIPDLLKALETILPGNEPSRK